MQQPYLLPGPVAPTRRKSNFAQVFIAVFLAAFLGSGYLIWRRLAPSDSPIPPAPSIEKNQPESAPVADPFMDDLNLHLRNAIESSIRASELARQSQRRLRAVMPAMDRNYLVLEKGRLETADSLMEKAIRESTRASEELEIAQKLTQQHTNQGEKQ